jgi:6-phosphogluconate dehydrogenase
MVPAGQSIQDLASCKERGNTIIDGGNSYYRDDIARAAGLSGQGIHLVDRGTSGPASCGDAGVAGRLRPIFATIAPVMDSACRRGHFVKTARDGIEYAVMAAFAEGLNILRNADAGTRSNGADAETTPVDDPQCYQFDIAITAVAEVRRRGSVIESWLLDPPVVAPGRAFCAQRAAQ